MKKNVLFIITLFCTSAVLAQEPADALRFSWTAPSGTARQQAIGGAMGSLGGDLSATFVNPAGLAFYRTGDVTISPYYRFGKNKASYLGRTDNAKENNFTLGTSGFVAGSGSTARGKNVAIAIAVNRNANFNNEIVYRGANNQTSYSQKFLEEIRNNGIKDANAVATNYPYGTTLAFNTYWIDTVGGGSTNNYQFQSRAANLLGTGLLQEQTISTSGGINEFALGVGATVNDQLMFGGTIGIPVLNYTRISKFTEADATGNANNNFNYASFTEDLSTRGVGFNVKAGLIYKPQEYWRIGLALHSPTVYSLTDNYAVDVTTDTEGYQGVLNDFSADYANGSSSFKYMLFTPYKAIASISYVLREIEDVTKQRGFLTADVEYVNYKASSFATDDEYANDNATETYLKELNTAIDNAYKSAVNVRVGGELKFTTIMVRAGAAYYGNPYQNINGEKGSKLNLSGGLGYRNRGIFVDLTYVHAMNKDVHVPYRLQYAAYNNAQIRSTIGHVLMTLGFKF